MQILIQSSKENLEKNIFNIQKNSKKKQNEKLNKIANKYIEYINKINSNKKSSSKNFYLIISSENQKNKKNTNSVEIIKNDLKEKYFKIKECLSRCGNIVIEINSKKDIIEILNTFFNTRKNNINNKN